MELKVEYFDVEQIIGMGGPWVGKLKVDNHTLSHTFLIDNYIKDKEETLYVFSRYHPKKRQIKFFFGLFKTITEKRKFEIIVYNSIERKWFRSKDYWEGLFPTRIERTKIFYTQAFHDNDRIMFPEQNIEFNEINFIELNDNGI